MNIYLFPMNHYYIIDASDLFLDHGNPYATLHYDRSIKIKLKSLN